MPFEKYASVLLDVSIDKTLDYGIPHLLVEKARRGCRVEVPLRGGVSSGYILEVKDKPDFTPVKAISKLVTDEALITPDLFELALWMAKYYCSPLRQVFKAIVPATIRGNTKHKEQLYVMRAKTRDELQEICKELRNSHPAQATVLDEMLLVTKGILLSELLEKTKGSRSPVDTLVKKGCLKLDITRIDRSPLVNEEYFKTRHKTLNADQATALEQIVDSIESNCFKTHLIYGVTGSGKTEVYLQAIDKALSMGKGTIMLVPEISLTSQTIERFRSRFEGHIAVLHHRLSHGERHDEWHKIHRGEARIVIGARSAIFCPVKNLGLIIVDEEHENSYKHSDEMPCYHARDIAVMRANLTKATAVLGSATPSLESYFNALKGKYVLNKLGSRADACSLPNVTIVDMNKEREKGYSTFADTLLEGIKRRYKDGEQTILFLNRRGYHTTLLCQECRHVVQCHHCDTALTFHLGENCVACHLCGFSIAPPTACSKCSSPKPMKYRGVGTEQVEKALHAVLPDIRTMRMDADTTKHKGSHQKLLRAFGSGKADVLIGTQMIAKGLHFPQVTLVGVLNSDVSLNIPDFKASETAFQLITQVAGRAGRGVLPGEVIIQTCLPDNTTIGFAAKQDYSAFYEEEIASREMFRFPPFAQVVKLAFSGTQAGQIQHVAERFRQELITQLPAGYQLNPLIPAGHAKVKDKYRFQFLVRGSAVYPINHAIALVQEKVQIPREVSMRIDVNPSSTYF